jgi:sucrose porin
MKRKTLAVAVFTAIVASASTAPVFAAADDDNGITVHAYAMTAGDLKGEAKRPKSMALHIDPTGPNQDPRGKLGDLGNSYWHDYFTSLMLTKEWKDVFKEGQWSDFNFQLVGYGDKAVETAQSYIRFGGLDFLPENSHIWAGRRYDSDRISVFAYNIKEINVDAGLGYVGENFEITVGQNQIDWADFNGTNNIEAIEPSRQLLDMAYRIGNSEFGLTFVNETDNGWGDITGDEKRKATSIYAKYTMADSFLGMTAGSTMLEAQYGKGVIAQYLNTHHISGISEEGDKSMRLTLDGMIVSVPDVTIKPAIIYEYTDREDLATRATGITGHPDLTYGMETETGLFAGVNVHQKMSDNLAMEYEANLNHTNNKNGLDGVSGNAYKIGFGPVVQLSPQPWIAPQLSLSVAYVGGDQEITGLTKDSEFRFGYRMQVWF